MPLKERIRFLGIHSNNRDEFFRVRCLLLKKMIQFNDKKTNIISEKIHKRFLIKYIVLSYNSKMSFNRIWKKIIADLKKEKVFLVDDKHLNAKQKVFVKNFFDQEVARLSFHYLSKTCHICLPLGIKVFF